MTQLLSSSFKLQIIRYYRFHSTDGLNTTTYWLNAILDKGNY